MLAPGARDSLPACHPIVTSPVMGVNQLPTLPLKFNKIHKV